MFTITLILMRSRFGRRNGALENKRPANYFRSQLEAAAVFGHYILTSLI